MEALSKDESTGLETHLIDVCEAVRAPTGGRVHIPQFKLQVSSHDFSSRKKERLVAASLPKMIEAKRAGESWPIPAEWGDTASSTLFTIADLIRKKHLPAAEYFLLWISAADEKMLTKFDSAVERNLRSLAALPASHWPSVDYSNARVPLVADCLRYIQSDAHVPESVQRQLSKRVWNELSDIALTICTEKSDRSVAPLLAKRLSRDRGFTAADAVAAYYKKVGTPEDLPLLERYAYRIYPKPSDDDDWLGFVRADVEAAIRTIRLKELLLGTPQSR